MKHQDNNNNQNSISYDISYCSSQRDSRGKADQQRACGGNNAQLLFPSFTSLGKACVKMVLHVCKWKQDRIGRQSERDIGTVFMNKCLVSMDTTASF